MIEPTTDEGRADEAVDDGKIRITFVASCAPCAWLGSPRLSNLTALRDYDRHAETASHILGVLVATEAPDEDEPIEG